MKGLRSFFVLSFLSSLAACFPTPSLHPFYQPSDPYFDERLSGAWVTDDGLGMSFEQADSSVYRVELRNQDDPEIWQLEGRIFKLGPHVYLDLTSRTAGSDLSDELLVGHRLPVHTLHRIEWGENTFRLAFLDDEFVKGRLETENSGLAGIEIQDTPLLISPTEALQNFILRNSSEEAFPDPQLFRRPSF